MEFHFLNPLTDPRWDDFVSAHPKATAFHQRGWLEALVRTYGYAPIALTSTREGPLKDGIVFCGVKSWITGTRLVSLPFTDHCEPLAGGTADFASWLRAECDRRPWQYIELRPLDWKVQSDSDSATGQSYWFHTLDLTTPLELIFARFHKDSIQRRIRRAEREPLRYVRDRSEESTSAFYNLLMKTRRRHGLLPQPRSWFRNLIACMGEAVEVRVLYKDRTPVAAIMTLRYRDTVIYKYGCSDGEFHNLGGMPLLFWRLIEESKTDGARAIDFGRTDLDNDGLATFKDRFGTVRKKLTYLRYQLAGNKKAKAPWEISHVRNLFSLLPDFALPWAGGLVYRHLG